MLVTLAAGYGLIRGLRDLDNTPAGKAQIEQLKARIDALGLAVSHLGERVDEAQAQLSQSVSHEELSRALDKVFGKLEKDMDVRFERQTRSVEALRTMVGQTDELLQKVLDGLEAIRHDRDTADTR